MGQLAAGLCFGLPKTESNSAPHHIGFSQGAQDGTQILMLAKLAPQTELSPQPHFPVFSKQRIGYLQEVKSKCHTE